MGEAESRGPGPRRQVGGGQGPPTEHGVLATRDAGGAYRPFPVLSVDFDLSTAVREVRGLLEFHITISNRDRKPMEHLVITPALPEDLKLADEPLRRIGSIAPGESATVKFKLSVSEDARTVGIKGRPLPGLDFAVQTSLRVRKGKAKYDVTLENLHEWTIRQARIEPKLPYGVLPLEQERVVEALGPSETQVFAFDLISQEEVDRKARHEARLGEPVASPEEGPRVEGRRFPREHTEAEVAEVVRWLEELQVLGVGPGEETMLEDLVEFGPNEYPLEILRLAEALEIGPLEERFITVDYEAEFKPPPPARPVLAPVEFTGAQEEGFIHIDEDEFASIKPLGLSPTIAEEIEIEPMEMDL
jgi:hypothetical protein